ncbi:MAG: hypothetical protein ACI4S3_10300, partial [Candidatus Gastranaerophilaceae bacterium]
MSVMTFEELVEECRKQNKTIYELVEFEEAAESDTTVDDIRIRVKKHIETMKTTINTGMSSSEKAISDWCGDDCKKLQNRFLTRGALFGSIFEKIITYSLATIEENLRMGKVVAC